MRELDPVALARDIAQTLDIPWELSSGNSPTLAAPNRRHVANRVLRHRRRRCLLPELGTMSVPSSSRCRYDDTLIALVSLRCPGHPGGTATGSESSTRALPSNTQGGKNMRTGFAAVFTVIASSVLLSGLTEAHVTDVQAPRMQEVQAPRMQEVQAPRMQEVQAPRMQEVQAPRMQEVQAPRMQEV